MICLDTNVAIGVINADGAIRQRLNDALERGETIAVSVIVVTELMYGAEHSARREHNLRRVGEFLAGSVEILDLGREDAGEAAQLRETLARMGRPIGPYDVLIAAQARRRGATLVTANTREFARVPGLTCLDWWSSPEPP